MSESRLRIPRVALATLVLGGGSCGDESDGDGGGGAGGADVSSSRIANVASAICKRDIGCEADEVEQEQDEDECASEAVSYLTDVLAEDRVCADAMLDYYACYATLGCEAEDQDENKCSTLGTTMDQVCASVFDEDADLGD